MEKIDPVLPEWISRQASLGPNIKVDGKNNLNTEFWYLLTMCCPLIFEKYAIILHPFWINYKVQELSNNDENIPFDAIKNHEFESLKWKDFFQRYDRKFDLETASIEKEEIRKQLVKHTWPQYLWFPGEGDLESETLIKVRDTIINVYDDVAVNNYYCLLKTTNWESDIIYKGKISELEKLWTKDDIRDNPTAIFPNSKEWCIVSDYDLPFTYIGGSSVLIGELLNLKNVDLFPITPKFNELEKTAESKWKTWINRSISKIGGTIYQKVKKLI
jgi:hypothetical protein